RGLLQVSGLSVTYDLTRPEGQRLISVDHGGVALADEEYFTVAAPGFLAEGGDLYTVFAESANIRNAGKVSEAMVAYFARNDVVALPSRGRQVDIGR
ncbi:MAG: 5'-nucleotidase C-terminal domain-containing protein, partial [Woeseiaceae bacterium]